MKRHNLLEIVALVLTLILIIGGYFWQTDQKPRLIIATTTSTVDTGLLDYLKPYFDKKFNADMTWLYLGTGQALSVASRGDADVLLVHDRVREDAFINSGNGTHRVTVMYNDFVIIGPKEDPAGINGLNNATLAFQRIAKSGELGNTVFVSRGDGSGTNTLELKVWNNAGISPKSKSWYLETGQGMGPTIRIANEKQGYTITDRGTWIKLKKELKDLKLLVEKDNVLLNPYSIIIINPVKYPNINSELAEKFLLFMISDEGQRLIGSFKIDDEQIFYPIFGKVETIGLPSEQQEVGYWVKKLIENGMQPPSYISIS
jgi:tungstate transport system substrate-binding protein